MPKIRCHYWGCIYLYGGYCSAPMVDIDPDEGCLTFTLMEDPFDEDVWENELEGTNPWDDDEFEDEWLDDGDY